MIVGLTAVGREFLRNANRSGAPPKLELPVPPEIEAEEARSLPRRPSAESSAGPNASEGGVPRSGEASKTNAKGAGYLSLKQVSVFASEEVDVVSFLREPRNRPKRVRRA
jgi:hypothetical protein